MTWTWAAARCRGTSHIADGSRCQDAFNCFVLPDGRLVGILCDGAGSALKGGEGASVAAKIIGCCIRRHFELSADEPSDEDIRLWIDHARDSLFYSASMRGLLPREFACTLVVVICALDSTLVVHVGDGCAVGKLQAIGSWVALTWPAQGEYASTTYFLTDDPTPRLRINRTQDRLSAVVVFTDGLERLALDFAQAKPHEKFFEGMIAPIVQSNVQGQDYLLSRQLRAYLASDAVCSRTDDDKTILIAAQR